MSAPIHFSRRRSGYVVAGPRACWSWHRKLSAARRQHEAWWRLAGIFRCTSWGERVRVAPSVYPFKWRLP